VHEADSLATLRGLLAASATDQDPVELQVDQTSKTSSMT
jgi:hypothetical protein